MFAIFGKLFINIDELQGLIFVFAKNGEKPDDLLLVKLDYESKFLIIGSTFWNVSKLSIICH